MAAAGYLEVRLCVGTSRTWLFIAICSWDLATVTAEGSATMAVGEEDDPSQADEDEQERASQGQRAYAGSQAHGDTSSGTQPDCRLGVVRC
jgi:hypothetical protein